MSIKAMNWAWQIDLIANKKLTLLCLADHADNDGVCWPGISAVVEKTGLSRRTVINFLQDFEAGGLLTRQQRKGANGRQQSSVIELNLKAERMQFGAVLDTGLDGVQAGGLDVEPEALPGANSAPGSDASPGAKNDTYRVQKTALTGCKNGPVCNEEPSTEPKEEPSEIVAKPDLNLAEDDRLAHWMFGLIQKLHSTHRAPSWRTWTRDLRLIRERDGRTHREMATLFAFANEHEFWCRNILSPAKLREQWDRLEIERAKVKPPPAAAAATVVDRQCAFLLPGGMRCQCEGRTSVGRHLSSSWYCDEHLDIVEAAGSRAVSPGALQLAGCAP
jgi:hypothetical protein